MHPLFNYDNALHICLIRIQIIPKLMYCMLLVTTEPRTNKLLCKMSSILPDKLLSLNAFHWENCEQAGAELCKIHLLIPWTKLFGWVSLSPYTL